MGVSAIIGNGRSYYVSYLLEEFLAEIVSEAVLFLSHH
jgi:hypothetical protein